MFRQISVVNSCDLDHYISFKIGSIEGELDEYAESSNSDQLPSCQNNRQTVIDLVRDPRFPSSLVSSHHDGLFVECGLYINGRPVCPPQRTTYKKQNKMDWREWIIFPVLYRDVTYDTKVCLTVWDVFSPRKPSIVGGCTFYLFDLITPSPAQLYYQLKMGSHKLKLWRRKESDFSDLNTTPGEIDLQDSDELDEMTQIEKIWMSYDADLHEEWLKRITFNTINEKRKDAILQTKRPEGLFLNVELLKFEYPVIYSDQGCMQEGLFTSRIKKSQQVESSHDTMITTIAPNTNVGEWIIIDPEINKDNPCAVKHLKLTMHLSTGFLDRDLRPDATDLKILTEIVNSTPLQEITPEEKTIIWKYRYWLMNKKRALTKFLKCVDWDIVKESREATDLLMQWAEIDTVDALELLSKFFQNVDVVRNYAVGILKKADNEEVLGILLQLVQALRYEKDMRACALTNFLFSRSLISFEIANHLNWYLQIESDDPVLGDMYAATHKSFLGHVKKQAEQTNSSFLFLDQLYRQQTLVKNLIDICSDLKQKQFTRETKIKNLKKLLEDIEHKDPSKIPGPWKRVFKTEITPHRGEDYLRLPLNPKLSVIGIYPDDATVFKSATNPVRLSFVTAEKSLYKVIFKIGDDLRQDQLIIQLITLMDKLLKNVGLDLKLTPYKVLACSKNEGFLEFVDRSSPFELIIQKSNIRVWLEKKSKGDQAKFEIACDNFVKSCAGYCVITYILGIGDRHLENLLLTPDGKLFHIDFGFILGRDPKHFAPPMKLCKEMVEGMGGRDSIGYNKFLELCCTAYNVLRRNSHWILNMFVLMVDAGIKDIDEGTRSEQQQTTANASIRSNNQFEKNGGRSDSFKNIMKVQERLKLELNDAEAIKFLQGVIGESERALFAPIHDAVHRWAQYWRN